MRIIKKLFCKHKNLSLIHIMFGDEITWWNGKRAIYKCEKCGKIFYK